MERNLSERGLMRTLVRAGLVLFGVFLAWRFLAGIATVVLLILLGLLLAVILSGPVEALHRRKVPRPVSSPLIVVGILALPILAGYLLLPQLSQQGTQVTFHRSRRYGPLTARYAQRLRLQVAGVVG